MKVKVKRIKDNEYWEDKIPIKFSIDTLNIVLAYIISDSETITRGNLTNARKLFNLIDERIYDTDYQLIARLKFIKRALRARLEDYMENPVVILESCRSNKYADVDDEIIEDVSDLKLRANEIKYVTSMISDKLTYSYFFKYKDNIVDLIDRLDRGEYESFKKLSKDFKKELTGLLTDIRRTEQLQSSEEMFSLGEELFASVVTKTVKTLQSPSNVLKTNIQALNEMLNGGFEARRLYSILAISGGFKSGTLLNLAYQMKTANINYKTKDPLKTPTILLVTHENTVEETVDRLFSLAVGKDTKDRLKNYTPKEAIKLLKTKGKMRLTKENNIDLVIVYKASGTIDTSDLYSIIDDLEEEGREVICLLHDYIKKIKSVRPNKELRLELSNITDELKALAIEKNIPVITANQLNRDAARTIDAGIECNKTDLARSLGAANVSESWNIIENSDCVILVNRERQLSENKLYLTMKRLKMRDGSSDSIDYFNHPFADNEFGLISDVGGERLSKKYLSEGLAGIEEDNVIKFDKRGRTNSKNRQDISQDDNQTQSLNDLMMSFAS